METLPNILSVVPTLAPIESFADSRTAADFLNSSTSAARFASLSSLRDSHAAFASVVAASAIPCGIRKFLA